MRHNLSLSWLNYNWRTKATTDDHHHHRSMQVTRDDHTFCSKNCMETKVHSAKQKSGHHFIYLEDYIIQRWMNTQSGFNAEQIEKDKLLESKTVWRFNLNNKLTQQNKNCWLVKSTSNDKRRLHISLSSPLSSETNSWLVVSKLTTRVTSQALN